MALQDLVANLRLNISQFTNSMNNVRRQTQRFSSAMASVNNQASAQRLVNGYTQLDRTLHRVGLGFRDVARIASGITISQTFYGITRSINEATDALTDFIENLDYAQVTYSALFNDSELASNFIDTLKDFSVDTIFEYSDIEGMARKLSAYGIEYKNLMYIIEGLTNLGTISGDSAALERLAVALGQINAKGKLSAEEVRQLANAYVPINDILRDKLGVTEEGFKSIGDLGISSADAINAIIEYANETFGATAEAAVYTITGLKNKIVDTLKVMGADMMTPITTFHKSLLKYIADSLSNILSIYQSSGLGGVFEHLIPSEAWQNRIRQLLANLSNFFSVLVAGFRAVWPVISNVLGGFIDALNFVMSAVNFAGSAINGVLYSIGINTPILDILTRALVTAAAGWMLFKAKAIGAAVISGLTTIIMGVAKAVLFLAAALTAHPVITMLVILGAALIGVSANANNANNAISQLMKSFNSYSNGGKTTDDILQVGNAAAESGDKVGDYWNKMEDGANGAADALDNAGNKAKKAAKDTKSLLSFDEVFRLNDPSGSSSSGTPGLSGLSDLTNMLGGLGSALIPEIPDLSDYAKNFVGTLYNDLWQALKTIATGGATGAVIGGLVGFTIGGLVTKSLAGAMTGAKWGAAIGSIAGAGFAGFWTDTYKQVEDALIKTATGGALGALAGGLVGLVIGAFVTQNLQGALAGAKLGAGIGGLIGAGVGAFWGTASKEVGDAIKDVVAGTAAGALTGGLVGLVIGAFATQSFKGALAGAKLGATIGTFIGTGIGAFWAIAKDEIDTAIKGLVVGSAAGAVLGGLAGFVLGAIVTKSVAGGVTGAKWGVAIGTALGSNFSTVLSDAESSLQDKLENLLANVSAMSKAVFFGSLAGMIMGAVVGTFAAGPAGTLAGAKIGAVIGSAIGSLGSMIDTYLKNSDLGPKFIEIFDGLGGDIIDGLGAGISNVLSDGKEWVQEHIFDPFVYSFKKLFGIHSPSTVMFDFGIDLIQGLLNGVIDLWKQVTEWLSEKKEEVSDWFTELKNDISTWFEERISDIKDWWDNLWDAEKWETAWSMVTQWFTDLKDDVSEWFTTRVEDIKTWWKNLFNVSSWSKAWTMVTQWFSDLKTDVSNWFTTRKEDIKSWWKNLFDTSKWSKAWSMVTQWFSDLKTDVSSWFATRKEDIKTWWKNLFDTSKWSSAWSMITTWFSNLKTELSTWFTNRKEDIKSWWKGLFDTSKWSSAWSIISGWFSDLKTAISTWFSGLKTSVSTWWDNLWKDKTATVNSNVTGSPTGQIKIGHAKGGIFNRENIARFAEGNKTEAVIPLEDRSAMQPFVAAISDGILQGLLPAMSSGNGGAANNLPPLYVGTLIADERGLNELYKKFEVYQVKELARKGLA